MPRESERKARREIANSNERRRMQSINAGFQALRKMLQPRDGDKLSKVSYLIHSFVNSGFQLSRQSLHVQKQEA